MAGRKEYAAVGDAVHRWWQDITGSKGETGQPPRTDRAALAELRRCDRAIEAVFLPAFHDLRRRVSAALGRAIGPETAERGDAFAERLAVAAILAAHVRAEPATRGSIARALGARKSGSDGDPVFSELRFRRLLQCESPDELLAGMRRAVAILGRAANIADLAGSIAFWGDKVRTRWAYDYFGAPDDAKPDEAKVETAESPSAAA